MAATQRRGRLRAVSVLFAVVATAGCSPAAPPTPTFEPPPTVTTSASPRPVSSPPVISSPSPSVTWDEEQTAAAETVLIYFRLLNDLRKDFDLDLQPLSDMTVGRTQEADLAMLIKDRESGILQTGNNDFLIRSVGKMVDSDAFESVLVTACTDSSDTDLVDVAGNSVLPSDRAFFLEWIIEVVKFEDEMKIGDITNDAVDTCDV